MPSSLSWLRGFEAGRAWLTSLPTLLAECAERWSLTIGRPFDGPYVSLVLPATVADGAEVVLKVQFPDRESEHEADALARWDGNGAVRLLAHDAERHALLMERCRPGSQLAEAGPEAALDVFASLLPRLWLPASAPFLPLADEARRWAEALPSAWDAAGGPFDRELLDEAVGTLEALGPSQGEQVLVHQDLHAANVLRAEREPWLAIDPKPLVGEREFAIAPIVRGPELGHRPIDVTRRLHRLTDELGLDRERARGWAFCQTLAWAFEAGTVLAGHVETARWLRKGAAGGR